MHNILGTASPLYYRGTFMSRSCWELCFFLFIPTILDIAILLDIRYIPNKAKKRKKAAQAKKFFLKTVS